MTCKNCRRFEERLAVRLSAKIFQTERKSQLNFSAWRSEALPSRTFEIDRPVLLSPLLSFSHARLREKTCARFQNIRNQSACFALSLTFFLTCLNERKRLRTLSRTFENDRPVLLSPLLSSSRARMTERPQHYF